jgi:hypothetical protein
MRTMKHTPQTSFVIMNNAMMILCHGFHLVHRSSRRIFHIWELGDVQSSL